MNGFKNRIGLRFVSKVLAWLRKRSQTAETRRLQGLIIRIEKVFSHERKHLSAKLKERDDEVSRLLCLDAAAQTVIKSQDEQITQLRESLEDAQSQVSTKELTLDDKDRYISELERTIQERDTTISLQRMEIESLTLWRENQNRQLRTEADIAAAKSKVLTGNSPERILEKLTDGQDANDRR